MAYDAQSNESVGSFAAAIGLSPQETWDRHRTGGPTQGLVRHFHRIFGYDVADVPTKRTWRECMRRDDLISEEVDELRHELGRSAPDIVKVAHEAADLVYVLYGLAVEFGFDLDECVREVHRANMTKDVARNGAKAIKGDRFTPANIERIVHG